MDESTKYRLLTFEDGNTAVIADSPIVSTTIAYEGEGTAIVSEKPITEQEHAEYIAKQVKLAKETEQVVQSENDQD